MSPVAGLAIASRWAGVMRGSRKPLSVLCSSSRAEGSVWLKSLAGSRRAASTATSATCTAAPADAARGRGTRGCARGPA